MREQPRQSYFPRAKVKIILRLEDFGARDVPPQPKKPPHLRRGKAPDNAAALRVMREGSAYVLVAPDEGTSRGGGPQEQTSSQDGRTFKIDGVVPVEATLLRNGIRTADTLNVAVRFLDFPIDPRVCRSVGVVLFLGCVPEDEHARQALGIDEGGDGTRPLIACPETFVDADGRTRSNKRFEGFVDRFEDDFGDDGEPLVRMECTDNTRLLIGQNAPAKLSIGADAPIDKALADYLAAFPQFRGLRVEYRPAGTEPPTLGKALAKTAFRPQLGPAPAGGAGGGGAGADKLTVWDYITDVAGAIGLVARVEGTTIVLQRPRTLYSSRFSGRPDDPFRGRILPSGRKVPNRLWIYGENVRSPKIARDFVRAPPQNVEVRCYSGRLGKTLVGRYPGTSPSDRVSRLVPGDAADDKWHVLTVHGIEDEAVLRAVAQSAYEQMGRNELQVRFGSKNLGSMGGGNLDPDALDCQAGDAIELEFARYVGEQNSVTAAAEALDARASAFLQRLGFDGDFAKAYGQAVAHVGLATTFRVRTLAVDWSIQEGIQLDFECSNYVEVRADKSLPRGEEIEPATRVDGPTQVVVGE